MQIFVVGLIACLSIFCTRAFAVPSPLKGKKICVDAGHGGSAAADHYRVGVKGEREEWINLRVALLLKEMLEKKGALVIMTRIIDTPVDLSLRADIAVANKVDAFISIHHNATADRTVNFPIIYYHGAASENIAGVTMGQHLADAFHKYFYKTEVPLSLVSDYCIFPAKGAAVLRNTYGIPGLLAEASFFTNEEEEQRLKRKKHNRNEAKAYLHALEAFFSDPIPGIKEKKIPLSLPVFEVFQEADRMKPEALKWKDNYDSACKMLNTADTVDLVSAYDLFTLSARAFPDSYVAGQCHMHRTLILERLGRNTEAAVEKVRVDEFYPKRKL
jgi:N-acetylmuramoyl-L-alanine amidase